MWADLPIRSTLDRSQLDIGVFQDLLQTVDDPRAFFNQGGPMAREVTHFPLGD
jgi:hypothetical protein